MTEQRMSKVSVEVHSGSARFRVSVQAENVRLALGLVGERYPHGVVRLVFPARPERCIAREPSVSTRETAYRQTYEVAA